MRACAEEWAQSLREPSLEADGTTPGSPFTLEPRVLQSPASC